MKNSFTTNQGLVKIEDCENKIRNIKTNVDKYTEWFLKFIEETKINNSRYRKKG